MTFYFLHDDSIKPREVNSKKIKKLITSALNKTDIEFDKIEVNLENYGCYSVMIKGYSNLEVFEFENEDTCLNRAIADCVKGFVKKTYSMI
ncbi:MAG: hypothetical protein NE327_15565 [Lentisphaeraceae bacterium]|nr:hypothetical protein [Lentisphaeraceae bacterium]